MITPEPNALVSVARAVAKFRKNLLRTLATPQPAAQHKVIDEVWRPNRNLCKELRAIEKQQQQIEELRIVRPRLEQRRPCAVSRDETIESGDDAVWIGE